MITITGGKLTTWRRMAKMAVDRLVERDDRDAPCRTHEIPLGHAVDADDLPRVEGVPEDAYAALAGRYGHAAHDVLAIAAERGELAQPIVAGLPDLLAEALHAARREQATQRRRRAAAPHPARPARRARAVADDRGDRSAASPRRWAASWAGTRRGSTPRSTRFADEAAAEGIVVAG